MHKLNLNELTELEKIAINAAKIGGKILLNAYHHARHISFVEKKSNDFVTQIDIESENTIRETLKKETPEFGFLGEETGSTSGEITCVWVVDPLDGTTNFIHGFPFFAVSISLLENDEPVVGVVFDPIRNEVFHATKNGGAYLNGEKVRVTEPQSLKRTLIATGFPFREKDLLKRYLNVFEEVFLLASGVRRAGSASLDLAYTAAGIVDGFFEHGLSVWDIAAGVLLIKEAGGIVVDFKGTEDYLHTGNIIAGPKNVVNEILNIVKLHFPEG